MQTSDPEIWLSKFGLTSFRPGQRQVVDAILSGRDTLCIMPTGGGKSLCFQLPTMAREGVTIVVSPLIALMKDQVDTLNEIGIPATYINSSLSMSQQQARIQGMINGEYRLVYVAPERLRSNSFLRAAHQTNIQLLAVDEAHCISHWGHDFRPDYARLGRFRARLGNPQTIALTATATALVQQDIAKILELREPATFVTGFARNNLNLRVATPKSNSDKDHQLIEFLNSIDGAGIIYASTRKNCEHLVELLQNECNRTVAFYHAGMAADVRRQVQEDFMSGDIPIIVATNAFGMGIDKSDLRFVIHYNLPGSIEAYYQEAGRAGRDGLPSRCVMLYSFQDKFIQEFFIENSYPSRAVIKQVYEYLRSIDADPVEMTLQEIKDDLGLQIGTTGIGNCENLLEKANAIERLDAVHNSAAIRIDSDLPTLVDFLPRDAKTQRRVLRELERLCENFRRERVMFSTQRLAQSLDMKWEAVNRSIRQLVKLPMIDYIPPFRGRAIHVVDRKRRFEDLLIDFDELQRRKDAEQAKLDQMIRFATSLRCRQLEILEYFGDPDRRECGNCDNCARFSVTTGHVARVPDSERAHACLYVAQVALSGIARTQGRVGKSMVAQMLTGSDSKKLKQLHLHKLSTYGLLEKLRQSDVSAVLETLIERGFAQQIENTKFRPLVKVTPRGQELMIGKLNLEISQLFPSALARLISDLFRNHKPVLAATKSPIPKIGASENLSEPGLSDSSDFVTTDARKKSKATESIAKPSQVDDDPPCVREPFDPFAPDVEFDINTERSSNSKNSETTNPFEDNSNPDGEINEAEVLESAERLSANDGTAVGMIDLDDAALADLEFSRLQGTAMVRVDAPGQRLEGSEFKQHRKASEVLESVNLQRDEIPLPDPGLLKPSFFWSVQLLSHGYSIGHVEQIRKLDRATILDHVIRGLDDGLITYPRQVLSPDKIVKLKEFLNQHRGETTGQMLVELPPQLTPAELMYFARFLSFKEALPIH